MKRIKELGETSVYNNRHVQTYNNDIWVDLRSLQFTALCEHSHKGEHCRVDPKARNEAADHAKCTFPAAVLAPLHDD